MNGNNANNGNGSRKKKPVNKMEQAPTRHQPRRGVRNLGNARAAAQAAPQVRVSGPIKTRKAPRKNATPYARSSKNKANNISRPLRGLSFGKSSFTMKNFNKNKGAPSYAPHFAPSSFVPLNQQQAFQLQMNEAIARQAAANRQRLANMSKRRSDGAKQAAVTRKANKEALLAAQAAAAAAMEDVREAEQVVVEQGQSAMGVSPNAHQALAHALEAQRIALDEYTALQQALDDLGSTSAVSSSSAANYANENNGFAYAARANNRVAHANNGSASAASSASSTNASF